MVEPALVDEIRERLSRPGFASHVGFELVSLGRGESEIRLRLAQHHLNPGGIAHGGIAASLLDSAIGLALRTTLPEGASHATLQLHVTYLRPASGGTLRARGRAIRVGGRIEYGEGSILDDAGELVAHGTATFAAVPPR